MPYLITVRDTRDTQSLLHNPFIKASTIQKMVVARVNPLSVAAVGLLALNREASVRALVAPSSNALTRSSITNGVAYSDNSVVNSNYARMRTKLLVSTSTRSDESSDSDLPFFLSSASQQQQELLETTGMPNLVGQLQDQFENNSSGSSSSTLGIEDTKKPQQIIANPELLLLQQPLGAEVVEDQQVPQRLYSSLKYERTEDGKVVKATHQEGSMITAIALIAGSTVGAGVLAMPSTTVAAGLLPSSAALGIAWVYMTLSGLLIAELTLNRILSSGRPAAGLLDLYEETLSDNLSRVGKAAYLFLHYAVLVAVIAQGGSNLGGLLESAGLAGVPGIGQVLFAGVCGAILYASNSATQEKISSALAAGVLASLVGIIGIGSTSVDMGALINPALQHPEQIVNCFPILFLSFVYQSAVPKVVTRLEGSRSKITTSIIAGTAIPFLTFLAFNAVVLGNALHAGVDLAAVEGMNPVALLQSTFGGDSGIVANLLLGLSSLAVVTSTIGITNGLSDGLTGIFKLPSEGEDYQRWKPALYGAMLLPPMALAMSDPSIFYNALDCAGAFGVSTLFLVLPPFMAWEQRYGDEKPALAVKPMGKS